MTTYVMIVDPGETNLLPVILLIFDVLNILVRIQV